VDYCQRREGGKLRLSRLQIEDVALASQLTCEHELLLTKGNGEPRRAWH
jgi:hypothetical protein